ncbi:MAG: type IV toxin-antitoxin system AbiEi family antitoxin domain-containing protein [Microlunatus sp.]
MRERIDPTPELLNLATAQGGVLALNQAAALGLGRHSVARLLAQGHWSRISAGIVWTHPLRVGDELPWLAKVWSGLIVGGSGSRLGPRSSGFEYGLIAEPELPDIFAGSPTASARATGPWVLRREQPGARSARTVGEPPRLTVDAAVIDLCNEASAREVVGLLARTVQRKLSTSDRLLDELGTRARHRHRRLVRDILSDVEEGSESPLELGYLRDVERPHGLPRGRRQASRLGLSHVSDVGYDLWSLLVELDGRDGHIEEGRFRDRRRDNAFALRDFLTLRFGWYDVTDNPCAVAWQVAMVLTARGWNGNFRRCPRCRALAESDFIAMSC